MPSVGSEFPITGGVLDHYLEGVPRGAAQKTERGCTWQEKAGRLVLVIVLQCQCDTEQGKHLRL